MLLDIFKDLSIEFQYKNWATATHILFIKNQSRCAWPFSSAKATFFTTSIVLSRKSDMAFNNVKQQGKKQDMPFQKYNTRYVLSLSKVMSYVCYARIRRCDCIT
jgi:hypothetical protein